MAFPKRQITGSIYDGGGNVVTIGKIEATMVPAGGLVLDTVDPSTTYKVGQDVTTGFIDSNRFGTTGVQSFFVTALDSVNPQNAYAVFKYTIQAPVQDSWFEVVKITGVSSGALPIEEILPIAYGPTLESGYQVLSFVSGGGGSGAGFASFPSLTRPPSGTNAFGYNYDAKGLPAVYANAPVSDASTRTYAQFLTAGSSVAGLAAPTGGGQPFGRLLTDMSTPDLQYATIVYSSSTDPEWHISLSYGTTNSFYEPQTVDSTPGYTWWGDSGLRDSIRLGATAASGITAPYCEVQFLSGRNLVIDGESEIFRWFIASDGVLSTAATTITVYLDCPNESNRYAYSFDASSYLFGSDSGTAKAIPISSFAVTGDPDLSDVRRFRVTVSRASWDAKARFTYHTNFAVVSDNAYVDFPSASEKPFGGGLGTTEQPHGKSYIKEIVAGKITARYIQQTEDSRYTYIGDHAAANYKNITALDGLTFSDRSVLKFVGPVEGPASAVNINIAGDNLVLDGSEGYIEANGNPSPGELLIYGQGTRVRDVRVELNTVSIGGAYGSAFALTITNSPGSALHDFSVDGISGAGVILRVGLPEGDTHGQIRNVHIADKRLELDGGTLPTSLIVSRGFISLSYSPAAAGHSGLIDIADCTIRNLYAGEYALLVVGAASSNSFTSMEGSQLRISNFRSIHDYAASQYVYKHAGINLINQPPQYVFIDNCSIYSRTRWAPHFSTTDDLRGIYFHGDTSWSASVTYDMYAYVTNSVMHMHNEAITTPNSIFMSPLRISQPNYHYQMSNCQFICTSRLAGGLVNGRIVITSTAYPIEFVNCVTIPQTMNVNGIITEFYDSSGDNKPVGTAKERRTRFAERFGTPVWSTGNRPTDDLFDGCTGFNKTLERLEVYNTATSSWH